MINLKKYFYAILIIVTVLFLGNPVVFAATKKDGLNVNLHVGDCNNNGICEAGSEDFFVCPLDCTPVVVPDGPKTGGSLVIDNLFNDLTVEVSYTSAIIKWKSFIPTMSDVKWGTNPDYKDGVIRNVDFLVDHRVELNNLKEGTLYYFNIEAETLLGKTNSIENQIFRTLSYPDTTPPGNPTNVRAIPDKNGITVSWQNPKDGDFDYVRVMRNEDRFYASPSLGRLVYEGNGNYFVDTNVVDGKKYFYTLFARDRIGNYSSGAMISIVYKLTVPITDDIDTKISPSKYNFIVNQDSLSYDFKLGTILKLNGDSKIIVKTNHPSLDKNDDMWVEIRDKERNILAQYFFYREKGKDGFTYVEIPPFIDGGYYGVSVYKYDGKDTTIINQGGFKISKGAKDNMPYQYSWQALAFIIILLLLLLVLIWLLFVYIPKKIRDYLNNKNK